MQVVLMTGKYEATPTTVADGKQREVLIDSSGRLVVTYPGGTPQIEAYTATKDETADEFLKTLAATYGWDGTDARRVLVETSGQVQASLYGKDAAAGDTGLILTSGGRLELLQSLTGADAQSNTLGQLFDTADTTRKLSIALFGFNGTTWDRIRTAADAQQTGILGAGNMVYNPVAGDWNRMREASGDSLTAGLQAAGLMGYDRNAGDWNRITLATRDAETNTLLLGAGLMGFNGTSWDRIRSEGNDRDGIAVTTLGNLQTINFPHLFDRIGGDWNRKSEASATDAHGITGYETVLPSLFNGASADRQRGNVEGTALPSAARTATTASSDIINYNGRLLTLFIDVTSITDTPSVTPTIDYKDPITGEYEIIWQGAVAITATGEYVYQLGPSLLAGAGGGYDDTENIVIPRTFRLNMIHGDADSITYSAATGLNV